MTDEEKAKEFNKHEMEKTVTKYNPEMFKTSIGSVIIAYIQGMKEKDRPSAEIINGKYAELKANIQERCKEIVTIWDDDFVKSVINAACLPWNKSAYNSLLWGVYVNPLSFNITFSRGIFIDGKAMPLPLRDDMFSTPNESIGVWFTYDDFLKKTDEEIQKLCDEKKREVLKER